MYKDFQNFIVKNEAETNNLDRVFNDRNKNILDNWNLLRREIM